MGKGPTLSGAPADAGGMPIVRSGSDSGFDPDTLSETELCRAGTGEGGGGPPPPPQTTTVYGVPDIPGLLPQALIEAPVTGSGVPGWGTKPDQPPDSLCATPRVGCKFDPGGSYPTLPQVTSM